MSCIHSPYWTMQVIGDNNLASLQYVMDYRPYEPEEVVAVVSDEEDQDMDEEAVTEKEQMSELKRFYIEKFEGNVLREFLSGRSTEKRSGSERRKTSRTLS